jgi:hypothetical protein
MQLNNSHSQNIMMKATIIIVLPDALGTWTVVKAECMPIHHSMYRRHINGYSAPLGIERELTILGGEISIPSLRFNCSSKSFGGS